MFAILELIGVITFAFSGVIEAHRRGMDLVGVFAIAFVTAFGGGTLRDLLLDRTPLVWIAEPDYVLLVLGIAVLGTLALRSGFFRLNEESITLPDALGLGLFSAVGTAFALQMGLSPVIGVFMGVISATFGGVIRDVACNEVPVIFRRGQLYATCAFFASLVFWGLQAAGADYGAAVAASILLAAALRVWAVRNNVQLPI